MRFAAAVALAFSVALPFASCGEGQSLAMRDPGQEGAPIDLQLQRSVSPPGSGASAETTAVSSFRARIDELSCMHTTSVTRRFIPAVVVSYPEGNVDSPVKERLLITETLATEQRDDPCGHEAGGVVAARLSVAAAALDDHVIGKSVWSFEESEGTKPAHFGITPAGELWPSADLPAFYRVTYNDLGIYRSLRTGERLFAVTNTLLRVEVPRSPFRWRFVGFHHRRSMPPPPEAERDEKVIGVLQYGDDQKVFERLVLVADRPQPFEHTNVVLLQDGRETHWAWGMLRAEGIIDRRQISGFGMAIELYPSHWKNAPPLRVEIPIQSDEFADDAARLPAGVRIRR